jgi:hypothetical protein
MNTEILDQNRMIKLFFAALIGVILVAGCKGKDEKQTPSSPASTEQKDGTVQSQSTSSGIATKENSTVPPEVISDNPPKITSLKVSPETPKVGDTIKTEVATFDKEEDNVMLTYYWSRNGSELPETSDSLSLSDNFKRGDKIGLTVVPDDGKRKGNPVSVSIFVADSPPVIKQSDGTSRFDGRQVSHQIVATDPDGDPLTYALKAGPPGMTIDPATGLIKWDVPAGFTGKAPFTVSVTDGHGGEATQSLTLDFKLRQKK